MNEYKYVQYIKIWTDNLDKLLVIASKLTKQPKRPIAYKRMNIFYTYEILVEKSFLDIPVHLIDDSVILLNYRKSSWNNNFYINLEPSLIIHNNHRSYSYQDTIYSNLYFKNKKATDDKEYIERVFTEGRPQMQVDALRSIKNSKLYNSILRDVDLVSIARIDTRYSTYHEILKYYEYFWIGKDLDIETFKHLFTDIK